MFTKVLVDVGQYPLALSSGGQSHCGSSRTQEGIVGRCRERCQLHKAQFN